MENRNRWYRKWNLDVPREVVEAAVAANTDDPAKYNRTSLAGPYTPPDSEDLNGKTLVFRTNDKVMVFQMVSTNAVRFSENGSVPKDCFCNVKTLDHEIYLINQLIPGYAMGRQVTLVADLKNGCATVCDAHFGTENSNIDVGRDFLFGILDGLYRGGERHQFTDELVGKAMEWTYGPDVIHIKHMYTSNLYYTYSAYSPKYGAWMATNPADYVKLRDNVYIFSFVEERQHGLQAFFVIDFDRLHDMGCFFGVGADHVTSACVGAEGKLAPCTTIF